MNLSLVVLTVLFVSSYASSVNVRSPMIELLENGLATDGKIVALLNKLKSLLQHGNATLGIPVLDPFQKKELQLNLNKQHIAVRATLNNVEANGLSMYTVDDGDFSLIGLHITVGLTWKQVTVMTNYNVNGTMDDISLYGNGHIAASLHDLSVKVNMNLGINDTKLDVSKLVIHPHLAKLDFVITGLFNDPDTSKVMSQVISDVVPQMLEDYQNEVSSSLSSIGATMFNKVLSKFSISDLLGMLS